MNFFICECGNDQFHKGSDGKTYKCSKCHSIYIWEKLKTWNFDDIKFQKVELNTNKESVK